MRQFRVVVNGNEYKVGIEELQEESKAAVTGSPKPQPPASTIPQPKTNAVPKTAQPAPKSASDTGGSGLITAAMPGTILDVKVNMGDNVTRGQALLILEAMKMENEVMATCDGVVAGIHVEKGASVNSGDLLVELS